MSKASDAYNAAYRSLHVDDDPETAEAIVAKALASSPEDPRLNVLLGCLYSDKDQPPLREKARQLFLKGLETGGQAPRKDSIAEDDPIHHLGLWYAKGGDWRTACLLWILDATAYNPEFPDWAARSINEALPNLSQEERPLITLLRQRLNVPSPRNWSAKGAGQHERNQS